MRERRDWIRGMLVVALLMLGFAIKGVLLAPPSPPSRVAAGEFDTNRAITRLQRILGDERPHPVDSAADDAVRGRLIEELRKIGLQPEVQEAMDCSGYPRTRAVSCSRVRNVIATIPAQRQGPAVLLDAHYDSTPAGPGAGDDGIGVATLLEVASTLTAAPPPRPVMLLFNEGEEFGLNGSAAFIRDDPRARQVNSLINIDARGVSGPATMFETSDPNAAALSIYASAARRPYANSLSTDFARLIPNTTDVVKFKPAHWTLLNFAIIGNETRYHTPGDTVAALDRASLYHLGSEVLALTRAMAETPEPGGVAKGQTVFTDIAGRLFIALPLPIATVLLGLLLIAAVFFGWRKKVLAKPLLIALGTTLAGISASAFVALVATLIRPGDFWRAYPLVTYLAVYAVVVATMSAIWARWGGGIERTRMRAAAWLLILLIGTALSIAMPGALIFFLWGPALGIAAIALERRSPRSAAILAVVATLVQFLMFAQLLALIEMLLIDGPLWAVTPLAALAVLPAVVELEDALRPAVSLVAAAAIGFWAAALLLPRSSAERPASFSIDYFRDASQGTASWGIAAKQAPVPRAYGGDWRRETLPYSGRTRWVTKAPLLPAPVPTARLMASEAAGTGRRVLIALSPGGGDAVTIRFAKDTRLLAAGLPGTPERIPSNGEPEKPLLRCTGRSCEGLIIEAVLADRRPIQAEVLSYRFSLPPEGRSLAAARPRNAIPQYAPDSTITMTRVRL